MMLKMTFGVSLTWVEVEDLGWIISPERAILPSAQCPALHFHGCTNVVKTAARAIPVAMVMCNKRRKSCNINCLGVS